MQNDSCARRPPLSPLLTALAVLAATVPARSDDGGRLQRAHLATMRLDVSEARDLLAPLPPEDPDVAAERALLALYEGDCDGSLEALARAPSRRDEWTEHLAEVARGCARVTASALVVEDEARGLIFRLKDDEDAALVPFLGDVADRGRATLERELGVRLPRPLRIEVVRDHYSLAAMTGLPEEAARTTGTVAVAKWGRVTMLSPRAAPHGYPWADTLMHEMTHLAVTRASTDRAPLWLQEGVAKRQEARWREPFAFDDSPPADATAKGGFAKGIALPLDRLGPSIAMLPTAEQAMVAFAEVTSFVRYWTHEAGDRALPRLLSSLSEQSGPGGVDAALVESSGADLHAWDERWRAYLQATGGREAEAPLPGGEAHGSTGGRQLVRNVRLGDLLAERKHEGSAVRYFEKAVAASGRDPSLRARLARALTSLGRLEEADRQVDPLSAVQHGQGPYLALRGAALTRRGEREEASLTLDHALWLSPWDVDVACAAADAAPSPDDPRRSLCEALRHAATD
jgi:tetratricopeptide (TPR) repeat protein